MDALWSDDYYTLLGIEAKADRSEVRRAWRQLALRWHPDRAGPSATAIFQKISAAYAVLSDPVARSAYDQKRDGPPREPPSSTPVRRRAPGVMLQRLSGPLNALLACGVARRAPGDVIELLLKDNEAAEGGMVTISMRVRIHCPECAFDTAGPCTWCERKRTVEELFSAWLAVPPGVGDGTVLVPSALLSGMVRPVSFRVRIPSVASQRDN